MARIAYSLQIGTAEHEEYALSDASDQWLHDELDLDAEASFLVDTLSPAEAGRMRALLETARDAHADRVDESVERSLSLIPGLLRGRVRKVLRSGR